MVCATTPGKVEFGVGNHHSHDSTVIGVAETAYQGVVNTHSSEGVFASAKKGGGRKCVAI
jgi:hypothetical protein